MVCWGACWCLVLWLHVIRCDRWFWMVCECAVCVFVLGVMVGFAVGYLVLRCFVLLCDCTFDYGYYMRLLWLLRYCLGGGVCFLVGVGLL